MSLAVTCVFLKAMARYGKGSTDDILASLYWVGGGYVLTLPQGRDHLKKCRPGLLAARRRYRFLSEALPHARILDLESVTG